MAYTKTTFINGQAPAVSAEELNKMGQGIEDAFNPFKHDIQYSSFTQSFTVAVGETIYIDMPVPEKRFYEILSNQGRLLLDVTDTSFLIGARQTTNGYTQNDKWSNPMGTTASSYLISLWYSYDNGYVSVVEIQKLPGILRFVVKQNTSVSRNSTLGVFLKAW